MLQTIRQKVASIFVKVLFGVLVLSFAIWGIGDIFRGGFLRDTVAEVGDVKIDPATLDLAYRRELNRLRELGVDEEQARQMGLLDQVLQGLISRAAFDAEAQDLGLTVSEATLRRRIVEDPIFRGLGGRFDRLRFQQILASNGLTEQIYVEQLRRDLVREQFVDSLTLGVRAPKILVDTLYRWRAERRVAETLAVDVNDALAIEDPDDTVLARFHKENAARFTAPEYRAVTFIQLRPEDLLDEVAISEEELRQAYEDRSDEFFEPERRKVRQVVLPDEATAKKAAAMLSEGRSFAAVAKEVAGQHEDATELGTVTRDALPKTLAEAVFALPAKTISKPVKGPFGWYVFEVTEILPGGTRPFAEVREQIRAEIAKEKALDAMFRLANELEDTLGGGASLEKAANTLGLNLRKVETLDRNGRDDKGAAVKELPPPPFLATVFETASGEESALTETEDGGYFILRVDRITPSRLRPLKQIRDEVLAAWKAERRIEDAQRRAKEAARRINAGDTPEEVARTMGLARRTTAPFTRDGAGLGADMPRSIASESFTLEKPGAAGVVRGPNGFLVVVLKEIQDANPARDRGAVEALARALHQAMADDVLVELNASLRARHGVSVNRDALRRLFFSDAG